MASPADYLQSVCNFFTTSLNFSEHISEPLIEWIADYGTLAADLGLRDNSRLSIFLSVDYSKDYPIWRQYALHYQNRNAQLVFRYDNYPHYPGLPFYPNHKHIRDASVTGCPEPHLRDVLQEIAEFIERSS